LYLRGLKKAEGKAEGRGEGSEGRGREGMGGATPPPKKKYSGIESTVVKVRLKHTSDVEVGAVRVSDANCVLSNTLILALV